ncbi:FAD-binding oxidoreductase [Conexibacter sp. JD483]|uniref:FAD-binding oxidoreductase n=1 Tax=unclassified Conexibacter TaxID=2627773 RepID=UPI00271E87C9|nr:MULTISPECIES: FAD-binding oxidoreductase [unclassified Conexibacter]MDO8189602.1 FAD-binding oxidoreductase [Conexibacter sp. CPCC 205706]MDO8202139.1 FAD-binding oxidoreductase [Conexibacter sp. CPCC 205762]MDR9373146.1 FAD-binding oxidoreductase [Conexibacter sp. JD483]
MTSITRRQLLVSAAAAAAGAPLAPAAARRPAVAAGANERAWRELERRLHGRLLRPGGSGYARAALPFNRRYAGVRPAGIARCASEADVREAILWAREHEIPLAARSGGHSYAGYSTTRGLLIDLGGMRQVHVDDEAGTVSAQSGARNTNVYTGLQPHRVAISAGRCPSVAIGGLALGGGFGFSSRAMGLTCDSLAETRLVTADGRLLTVSAHRHPDLFWALRGGGGGNFGISTSFRFRTTPVSDVGLYDLAWDAEHAPRVMLALQQMVRDAPHTLSCRMGMGSVGRGAATVTALGQLLGPVDELRELLGPVLAVARPTRALIARRTFWQAKNHFFHNTPVDRFEVMSAFVEKPLTEQAIDTIARGVDRYPGSSNPDGGGVALYAWGGQIARVAPQATAFVHREAEWLLACDASWTAKDSRGTVARNLDWLQGFTHELRPHLSHSAYQNFMDRTQPNWRRAYYGDNFARLARIKRRIDPDDVFSFRQGV